MDERGQDPRRGTPIEEQPGMDEADELEIEVELEGEPLSGSGDEQSGTLHGSVGGTTGGSGHNRGIASPGAGAPGFPGQSRDEAEELRRKHRQE